MSRIFYRNLFRWSYLVYAIGIFFIYFQYKDGVHNEKYYILEMLTYQKVFIALFVSISFYSFLLFLENYWHRGITFQIKFSLNNIIYSILIIALSLGFIFILHLETFALFIIFTLYFIERFLSDYKFVKTKL